MSKPVEPPPPPGARPEGRYPGRSRITVADGLLLVAWLFLAQIVLYGLWLAISAGEQTGTTVERLVQVAIFSAILASVLAWLGLRGQLGSAVSPGRSARPLDLATGLGGGLGAFLVLLVGLGVVFQLLGFDPPQQQALEAVTRGGVDALLSVVLAVALAPVVEELVFRGGLHQGLRSRIGPWPAAVVSSAVFAVVHLEVIASSPVFLVQLFLLGMVFAWLYERTGNLLAPVVAHLVFNGVSLTLAFYAGRFEELEELAGHVTRLV